MASTGKGSVEGIPHFNPPRLGKFSLLVRVIVDYQFVELGQSGGPFTVPRTELSRVSSLVDPLLACGGRQSVCWAHLMLVCNLQS
jgi:hypothetical protein